MIFIDAKPADLIEEYGFKSKMKCGGCDEIRELNKAYRTKDSIGLTADDCPKCGCMAPATGAWTSGEMLSFFGYDSIKKGKR